MKYTVIKNVVDLVESFEIHNSNKIYTDNINGFKKWIVDNYTSPPQLTEPDWEGKERGRSPESVISTLFVHLNRFAKNYSKSAILGSDFSTQEDFIYLINLKAFGEMTKMELIKKNIQEKPAGILIINRLILKGWVIQETSTIDKRSKVISITEKGLQVLDKQMGKIRQATKIVSGDLTYSEKMKLIRLLNKLSDFHMNIYEKNIQPEQLLDDVLNSIN